MGKGSAPKPPDPSKVASAQTDSNFATALMNQSLSATNQVTPFGSLTYETTGMDTITGPDGKTYNVPQRTATVSLNDAQQGILDSTQAAQGNLAEVGRVQSGRLNSILGADPVASPELTTSYNTDFSEDRGRVEEALMSRLNPSLAQDREDLRTSLANQGIREGSPAFDRAMGRLDEQSNDARMQAILAGGQEQSRLVGLERDRAGFENNAAAQQYGLDTSARQQPINEIMAILSGSQVQQPSFVNTPQTQMAGVDRAGLEMDAYNQNLAAYNNRQQGLGSLLGAGATILGAPAGSIAAGIGGLFR